MIYAHTMLGAVTTYAAIKNKSFSGLQKSILYFLGILGATFPDFDLLIILLRPDLHHRYLITHSLIPYSILFLAWAIFLRNSSVFLKAANSIFFLGVLTHLIMDYFFGGLVLFAPFTDITFGFTITPFSNRLNWALAYLKTKYMLFEVLIAGVFFYLWKKEKNTIFRNFPIFWLIIAAFMLGVLIFFE